MIDFHLQFLPGCILLDTVDDFGCVDSILKRCDPAKHCGDQVGIAGCRGELVKFPVTGDNGEETAQADAVGVEFLLAIFGRNAFVKISSKYSSSCSVRP